MSVFTIIVPLFALLWLAYFSLAIVALWRQRSWWRILPLVAALSVGALFLLPYRRSDAPLVLLPMGFLAAVTIHSWQGASGFSRGLRVLSAFWFLWFAMLLSGFPWA